jgi:type I restriction enzyme, S subunit
MSRYRPFHSYRPSGVPWNSQVPAHWQVVPLNRLLTEPVTDGPHETPDFVDEGVPFLSVDSIQNGEIIFDGKRFISNAEHERFALKARPKRDDILMGKAASIGKIARVKTDVEFNIWSPLALIRVDQARTLPAFIEYTLKSHWLQAQIETKANLNTQFNLGMKDIAKLLVSAVPRQEADQIASFLDRETARIDALIEKKTRFIELLREKQQALVTEAVTLGMDSSAPRRPTGIDWLGSTPSHWTVRPLKYIAAVQTGVAKGKDYAGVETLEVPYLRVANVQDGFLDLSNVATIEVAASEVERYLLRQGDVLMNEGGDFDKLGRGHVWRGEIDPCIHQNHVFAVRPTGVTSEWLNVFTGSKPAQFYFMARSKQSTNLASISSSNLMELPVPIPPLAEQATILRDLALKLERTDALRDATERSLALLRERRAALITAAVTGQIDVRADEPTEALEPA